ncbi:hypothetical protein BDF20DRAFT_859355 [Mycotypha africana]|uniref:uncharacterized protein n=1 Tax=Mycotypha africana TaxID=64632 RepID=UPI002300D1C8|nr:uncharacterized protein BDF20DRAFT_859355 [Mycotypha africana]KAI8984336.1 hypothetical protein BDF20DRAFT_859355 [Mycotypha africana]
MSLTDKAQLLRNSRVNDGNLEADNPLEEGGQQQQQRRADYGTTTTAAAAATTATFTDPHDHDDDEVDGGSVYVYSYPTHLQPGHFTSLEKLCFFLSSFLFILLCLFVGLYARNAIQKHHEDKPSLPLPTSSPTMPKPNPPNHEGNRTQLKTYCLESNCIITAAQILQDVDQELDPCDDFYAYTCSQWQEKHMIPETSNRIDIQSMTSNTIRHRLDHILTAEKRLKYIQHDSLPNPTDILDRQLFKKLSDFYRSCINQETIEQQGVEPLYTLLRVIRQHIPLSMNDHHLDLSATAVDDEQRQRALLYLSERDVWPLFTVSSPVIINKEGHRREILYQLGPGQSGLPFFELYEDEQKMASYMQIVMSLLDTIFQKDTSNEFGWKTWSTIATARRIIDFEKTIASTHIDASNGTTEWTLKELQRQVPEMDWTLFFPYEEKGPYREQITIQIPSVHFIENMRSNVLSNKNARTLQMYFIWRTIWRYVDLLGEDFLIHKRKWIALLEGREDHAKAIPERRDTCIHIMDQKNSAIGILLGRYYVLDHQATIKKAKSKLEKIVKQWVQELLISKVPSLSWVTTQSEQVEMIKKLKAIQFEIGYPPSSTDNGKDSILFDVLYLNEYFGDLYVDQNDFFGNVLQNTRHSMKSRVNQQQTHSDAMNAWKVSVQSVQVHYEKETNKIIIPAGLLQLPYFDPNGPYYLYLGAIGEMVGHEIMHEFDSLIPDTRIAGSYINRTSINDCLINQYNDLGIDGLETVNENFADNGGVSLIRHYFESNYNNSSNTRINSDGTYNSMTDHVANQIIPGIDHWTKEQIAYIQFSRMRCSKAIPVNHSLPKTTPDRFRVNGPIMNSYHFSKVFSCKKGSQMHPDTHAKAKCQVW